MTKQTRVKLSECFLYFKQFFNKDDDKDKDACCVFCGKLIGTNIVIDQPLMCGGCAITRLKHKSFE